MVQKPGSSGELPYSNQKQLENFPMHKKRRFSSILTSNPSFVSAVLRLQAAQNFFSRKKGME